MVYKEKALVGSLIASILAFALPALGSHHFETSIAQAYPAYDLTDLFVFDLFSGNRIHTTELLESPLEKGNNSLFKAFSHLYIGILNPYDLIASKLFRGAGVDFQDCLMLVKTLKDRIDLDRVEKHFMKLARYDISEKRIIGNIEYFLNIVKKEMSYG